MNGAVIPSIDEPLNPVTRRWKSPRPLAPVLSLPLAATVLCAGLSGPGAAAAREACPLEKTPIKVTVKENPGRVTVNTGHSHSQLASKQSKGKKAPTLGWQAIGLTLTELEFQMEVRVKALKLPSGRYCTVLESVDAELGYENLTVYIARKYRKGNCQYRSILQHENTHVAIFRKKLSEFTPRVKRRLKAAANRAGVVTSSSPKRAAAEFQQRIQSDFKPLFKELDRALDKANARIDTLENYRREQKRGPNW